VDIKLELGLTTHDINAQLFVTIFRCFASDDTEKADKAEEVAKLKKVEEKETELKKLAADFAGKVPEQEFSLAEIQLFLLRYRKSPAMAVQNVQDWVVKCREEKRHIRRADPEVSEEQFCSDNEPLAQDHRQAREIEIATAHMETPVTTADSHCCACQVLDDIMVFCQREGMVSVSNLLPGGTSGRINWRSG
jgi:hypothetical protein